MGPDGSEALRRADQGGSRDCDAVCRVYILCTLCLVCCLQCSAWSAIAQSVQHVQNYQWMELCVLFSFVQIFSNWVGLGWGGLWLNDG